MDDFVTKYGPWAVITGGASGTGYQFALKLAAQGFHLVLIARNEQALEETKEMIESRYHVQVKTIATDLSTPHSISEIKKITQSIDVGLVINNAGYSITGEFHREDWEDQSGVIFVSSSVAYTSMPLWSVYSAGKAALLHFGESISQEIKKYNIVVLTVCPGAMKTKFQERSGIRSPILMEAEKVAGLSLFYLGKKTTLLPGMTNRVIFQGLGRVLPGRIRLPIFESLMKKSQLGSEADKTI
ncbi:SDR family oxidoreductase [Sporosarcina sp. Te-1]|uniref:SDR family NAD(P)-dependent oxidoreductase n=1 Tax=Sporosarcina sp. Te-1 TaxID=2818390 RepID=UPI001A9DE7C9|nr:SDR family NAD(P)-dependent oxidoreductase [Sporosarcina sp. Te-1]QTD39506.1 SDR family NAD(P)-dependent oxidoreductase [Sporosarcina sp. Te-1]